MLSVACHRRSVGSRTGGQPSVAGAALDYVLGKDRLLAADARGVVGRGQIAGKDPDAVRRIGHDFRSGAVYERDPGPGLQYPDIDRLGHSAARAIRQVASSSQLSASMNSAQRRYRFLRLCSLDFVSVMSMTVPGRRNPWNS